MEVNLSDLPDVTDFTIRCEKKDIEVKGTKREITYENFVHVFYLCENSDCKHKASCIYLFTDEWYWCSFCDTLVCGLPGYKINPKSRICRNCDQTIINSLFSNSRLAGL